ncbi:MAG: hypothetical protein JWQ07_3785 [Ramlibacter sp.]|nr:hypothetical protein [Ramlibacter sp.]
MTDPRNIAHDKRVRQEKKHSHQEGNPGASQKIQPGRKLKQVKQPQVDSGTPAVESTTPSDNPDSSDKSAR